MENSTQKIKIKGILTIALNVMFYCFIAFLLIIAIASLKTKEIGIPNVFGKGYLSVQSPSMDGDKEDSFKTGDLVIVTVVNDKNREKITNNLKVGDIVTFKDYRLESDNKLNTHRIVHIGTFSNGGVCFYLQGDKIVKDNPSKAYDPNNPWIPSGPNDTPPYEAASVSEIVAVYSSKISGGGNVLDFMQTTAGFGLCIVLPTGLLLIVEGFFLIKNILKMNKEKMVEETALEKEKALAEIEEERQRMKEELLAELKKEQEKQKEE